MKTIGFVDYYISEWHANNYPAWIRAASKKIGVDYRVAYAYAERDDSPVDGRTTDEWCRAYGVTRCDSIAALCEASDCIIILAPSDPEVHWRLAKEVLPCGKPTYIDKTFAPDVKTAEAICDLAKSCGTPFFSTSALRFADELAGMYPAQSVITTGGGSNLEEYIIHQIEIAVKLLGAKPVSVRAETLGKNAVVTASFEGGKSAAFNYGEAYPFTVLSEGEDGVSRYAAVASDFFANLMRAILSFFERGEAPFDAEETLAVMQLREAIITAQKNPGKTIPVPSLS